MTLSARIVTSFTAQLVTAGALASPEVKLEPRYGHSWENGSGAGQASLVFSDRRVVAGAATDSIDLAGSLPGALGGTVTFTKLKEIFIKAADANASDLRVGKAVANAFVGPFGAAAVGVLIAPGGILHLRAPGAAGWTVTAGTGDLLGIENLAGAGNATFDIILIGA